MTDYEYLSVLISIVLGLGITNILGGLAGIVRNRHRVKLHSPVLVTLALLFLIHVQTWWSMFGLRDLRSWNIAQFFAVLMQPVMLYLASAMLVPDFAIEGTIDLREDYRRERLWFFGSLLLLILISLARPLILDGHLARPADLAGHAIFLVAIVIGLSTDSDRIHKIVSPAMLIFFIAYVATLFVQLT